MARDLVADYKRRRRRKSPTTAGFVIVFGLAALVLVAIIAAVLRSDRNKMASQARSKPTEPAAEGGKDGFPSSPKSKPADATAPSDRPLPRLTGVPVGWTFDDLLAHLNRQRRQYRMIRTDLGGFFGAAIWLLSGDQIGLDDDTAWKVWSKGGEDVVYVQLRRTVQEAKDEASTRAERAFSAGRFLFRGDPDSLDHIKAELP